MALEVLDTASGNVAVETSYLVIRALKHRSSRIAAPDTPFGEESIEAGVLAAKIVGELEEAEHRPLSDWDRARVEYYINRVAERMQSRVEAMVGGFDEVRGAMLLNQLRDEARL
jgi:hypothetical protein